MNVAVIGTGSVVREIYQYLYFRSRYSPLLEVVAICDTNASAMNAFGDQHGIPVEHRFTDYHALLDAAERGDIPSVDVAAVNTPDTLHRDPVIEALERGIDVLLPKPIAGTISDADAIVRAVEETGRFIGVDFHKRENPIVQETRARYRAGTYGRLQTSVWYMMDRLMVADPNHEPRFFASPRFASQNTPISFLMSHIADTFITITGLRPRTVRSIGYRQRLASLQPIAVDGYDLVDTEVVCETGAVAHFIAGWALPNAAPSLTVQSARMVFSDALVDLDMDQSGLTETTESGFDRPHVLFRTFREDGLVTGFGMDSPGAILENIGRFRDGTLVEKERTRLLTPESLGFWPAVICDCAELSLETGEREWQGVIVGDQIDVAERLRKELGPQRADHYLGSER